jgi:3-oxoacyl-[acyl-carrier-protein] synthase I
MNGLRSQSDRIVITGLGAVCAVGREVTAIAEAILAGQSGIGPITSFEAANWPGAIAGEVRGVDNRTLVEDRKLHKMITRTDLLGLYAAGAAVNGSGLPAHRDTLAPEAQAVFNDRSGVLAGSGGGNYSMNYDFFPLLTESAGDMRKFGEKLANTVNPMWLLRNLPNNVLCHTGIRHGFKGTNACITNHCASGILAVTEAAAAIQNDEADRAVAIGHDTALDPETIHRYTRLGLLAGDAVRPFDRDRAGTVLGEGAAAVTLEKAGDAAARGATVFGELLGSGCVTEAAGVLDIRSDGDGVRRAATLALADAGVTARDIGAIIAHGNGTPASDASEAIGLRAVFGEALPPITAFKWALGHTIAASGILDLVIAIAVLRRGVVPGIPTLRQLDPAFAPLPASASAQTPRSDLALLLCRGFGGVNVATILRVPRATV